MPRLQSYTHTIYASYLGYITQAVVNNFVPLLFLTLAADFSLSLGQITLITTVNFAVQMLVDLLSAKFVDRAGVRRCIVAAHIFAAAGLAGLTVTAPCSELDVTPTLLDLFGAAYDARFLSGRDLLADGAAAGPPALVSLYGSAYGDWVTDAGRYRAAEDVFLPAEGHGTDERYVRRMRQLVYDRYTVSRRILESNYFRLAAGR